MYNKATWVDRVVENGVVLQEGTPIDQAHLNQMEKGIFVNRAISNYHTQKILELKRAEDNWVRKIAPDNFTNGNLAVIDNEGGIADGGLMLSVVNGILRVSYDNGE